MTIDETKYLMEALEEVKERDRIIKCNTIDRVIEIIDRARNLCRKGFTRHDEKLYLSAIEGYAAAVCQDILALKGEQDFRTGPHTVVSDRITINGKTYWAADKVLEIIDEVAADNLIDDAIKINSVRNRVQMWLKGQTDAEA